MALDYDRMTQDALRISRYFAARRASPRRIGRSTRPPVSSKSCSRAMASRRASFAPSVGRLLSTPTSRAAAISHSCSITITTSSPSIRSTSGNRRRSSQHSATASCSHAARRTIRASLQCDSRRSARSAPTPANSPSGFGGSSRAKKKSAARASTRSSAATSNCSTPTARCGRATPRGWPTVGRSARSATRERWAFASTSRRSRPTHTPRSRALRRMPPGGSCRRLRVSATAPGGFKSPASTTSRLTD